MILLILIFSFLINFCYGNYVRSMSKGKVWRAAVFGELVTIMMFFNVRAFIHDWHNLIPVVIGGFFGTIATKKFG